ncbi:MAG: PAS domain-containing sensor histidine kinase, partial [Cytophagaceae bacterium]
LKFALDVNGVRIADYEADAAILEQLLDPRHGPERLFRDLLLPALKDQYADQLGEGVGLLERMYSASGRMSTLISDLLAFSTISTKQDSRSQVDLSEVVNQVLTDLEVRVQETGAIIHVDPLPALLGDVTQLGQLFLNLISNALKFQRPGVSPVIQINAQHLTAKQLPTTVRPVRTARAYHCISVLDNGIGFDEKYTDRIFQVFQRLHRKKEYSGTGIGLAICEKVVTNHGGAITAKSQPGEGATFYVYLPV